MAAEEWVVRQNDKYVKRIRYLVKDTVQRVHGRWSWDVQDALVFTDKHRATLAAQMFKGHVVAKEEE